MFKVLEVAEDVLDRKGRAKGDCSRCDSQQLQLHPCGYILLYMEKIISRCGCGSWLRGRASSIYDMKTIKAESASRPGDTRAEPGGSGHSGIIGLMPLDGTPSSRPGPPGCQRIQA